MKVYVAGKWSEKEQIHQRILELQNRGFQVVHDWTQVEQSSRIPASLAKYAQLDIEGVIQADILIVIMSDPKYAYRGTFTEIGCALGQNKPIVILDTVEQVKDAYYRSNCFFWHPLIKHVDTWEKVLNILE